MSTARLAGLALLAVACGKKNVEPPPPPVGWHMEPEGWQFQCYHPPDWGSLTELERKQARADALDAIMTQWKGEREDGVSFAADRIEEAEITLLGRPERIEQVVLTNLKFCKEASTAGASTDEWASWLRALPGKLTAGECLTPFDYTMFDYLDIGSGWQRTLPICQGDKVRVSGTLKDKYRVSDKGAWITVEGDPGASTAGNTEYPCNIEGCLEGQLVFRFVSDAGVETIMPVTGGELFFEAPEHGEISYRINDVTFYDNSWYKSGGIEDHTAIEISPAQ